MIDNNKMCVIIPTHKNKLSPFDDVSISKYTQFLICYDTFLVTPNQNDLELLNIPKITFQDKWFSYRGQNKLRMTYDFYKKFEQYEYMLIYELDALILSNGIEQFFDTGLDFIGAPIFQGDSYKMNSGFSLRNISKCLSILSDRKLKNISDFYSRNEDTFWTWTIPKYFDFKIPEINQALTFSFNQIPNLCFILNKHKLPLGCHAWYRYDVDFWLDKI